MSEKGWLGADLIFDLDGDHLPGVSDTDFPTMIDEIQGQAWRLWSEFLHPEFGFKEEYIQTTFSGHRGFHIHVRDPNLMHLDSNARREIVNYIRGEGIDIQSSLTSNSPWGGRAINGIDAVLQKLRLISQGDGDKKATVDQLHGILTTRAKSPKVKLKSTAKQRIVELAELAQSEDRVSRIMSDHKLSVFGDVCTPIFWELVKGDSSVVMGSAGETDEAVTVDTKRVIRWIGSLHGKSGLRVTEFPLERLEPGTPISFNPLSEAVAFGSATTSVRAIRDDVIAEVAGERVDLSIGDEKQVGESMAMFLCLKGWAELA
jgi:DNA primase small subunit